MIEPSPTAEQLLRFYIDAGVDAAHDALKAAEKAREDAWVAALRGA